ncbi:hypothetical protein NL676_009806 [Syzygium grande]|nr:hypothetical protein NL676_009806 [Syzygium grande]
MPQQCLKDGMDYFQAIEVKRFSPPLFLSLFQGPLLEEKKSVRTGRASSLFTAKIQYITLVFLIKLGLWFDDSEIVLSLLFPISATSRGGAVRTLIRNDASTPVAHYRMDGHALPLELTANGVARISSTRNDSMLFSALLVSAIHRQPRLPSCTACGI